LTHPVRLIDFLRQKVLEAQKSVEALQGWLYFDFLHPYPVSNLHGLEKRVQVRERLLFLLPPQGNWGM